MSIDIFAGISANESDEFVDGLCWHGRIDHENVCAGDGKCNRVEILVRIVRDLGEDSRVHSIGIVGNEQRIAVGSGPPRLGGAYIPAGTGNVLHIELLAQTLAQFLSYKPSECVGGAAGRIWYKESYRPRRI